MPSLSVPLRWRDCSLHSQVKALVLRGIFMLRYAELQFFYQDGASWLFPDAWDSFLAPIPVVRDSCVIPDADRVFALRCCDLCIRSQPQAERHHLMSAYHRRLTSDNKEERLACAKAWSVWEMRFARCALCGIAVYRLTASCRATSAPLVCIWMPILSSGPRKTTSRRPLLGLSATTS